MSATPFAPFARASGPGLLPAWHHVMALCDGIGMLEHADHAAPRLDHGYCTDDNARLLIAAVRDVTSDRRLGELTRMSYRFLVDAQGVTGRVRNRRRTGGRWMGRRGVDDCWGRSVWAFGTAARYAPAEWLRGGAESHFGHAVGQRSPHRRSMAFAALGAAELLAVRPRQAEARKLLGDAVVAIGPVPADPAWPWPEPRLTYANAALAEALVAAGHALERLDVLNDGLRMLGWLLDRQVVDGHLSLVPTGGAGPEDRACAFDQQPIEAAALADACARAEQVTGDEGWRRGVELAIAWFAGHNDIGTPMSDPATGGGYDGLTPTGPNLNQGAESTLALITTMQHQR